MDIVTLGELLIDMFPDKIGSRIGEVEAFLPKPGGAPANVAVAARRLGASTAFIGKVGEDLFGHYLKDVLDAENVDTRGLVFDDEARTTMAIIAMPDEYSAEFVFYRNPGADHRLQATELDESLIKSAKALHFGSLSLTDEPARGATFHAAKIARESGVLVSFDVNYRPSLWPSRAAFLEQAAEMVKHVNLVKVNEVEGALLAGMERIDPGDPTQVAAVAGNILAQGPSLVVVSLGAAGSYFRVKAGGNFIPAFRVDTVDAIGCGDAFIAGVLTRLVQGQDWRQNLTVEVLTEAFYFANAVGALTSLKRGAIPAMPNLKEVDKFLSERKEKE